MLSFIAEYSLEEVMLIDSPDKSACLSLAIQKLIETGKNKNKNNKKKKKKKNNKKKKKKQLMSDGNDQNGNKLRRYRTYKTQFKTEDYVKINMSRDKRKTLAKFRSCNLPLEIEMGRYTRP